MSDRSEQAGEEALTVSQKLTIDLCLGLAYHGFRKPRICLLDVHLDGVPICVGSFDSLQWGFLLQEERSE